MLQSPFPGSSCLDNQPIPPPGPSDHGTPLRKCPDLDLSINSTPECPSMETGILWNSKDSKQTKQVRFDIGPKAKAVSPQRASSVEKLPVVSVIQEPLPAPLKPTSRERKGKNRERRACQGRQVVSSSVKLADGELPEEAQLHSTLVLKVALGKMTLDEFDPQKAAEEKLRVSTHIKNHINIKAAEGVNFSSSQQLYHGLVSVSLMHEQLLSHALRHRPSLALPLHCHSSKHPKMPSEAPDLLAFYSPGEWLREAPQLPGSQVTLPQPQPKTRPSHMTFDLYHQQRQWKA